MNGRDARLHRWGLRAAVVCVAVTAGCAASTAGLGRVGGWDWNISDETGRWAGYRRGGIYETLVPLFLMEVSDRTNGAALVPGMEATVPPGVLRGPTTTDQYSGRGRPWPGVMAVIPAGTRLRATTLRAKGNVRTRALTQDYVKAQIIRGPHRGEVVDLEQVSVYRVDVETGRAALVGPNGDLLAEAG